MKLFTMTTTGNTRMCANMIHSLRQFSDTPVLVYCDDEAKLELENYIGNKNNIEIKETNCGIKNYNEYGSDNFVELCFKRIEHLITELENSNEDFVMIDTDVAFAGDPTGHLELVQKLSDYDFVFQTDQPVGSTICNGFFYIRNNQKTIEFFKKFLILSKSFRENEKTIKNKEIHDQYLMNQILVNNHPQGRELNSMVKWSLFPVTFATNGHLYFSVNETFGSELVVHCNFCVGEKIKIERLKSKNLWFMGDDDE